MAVIMSKQLVVPEAPIKGILASDIEIGGSVFLNVHGVATEFLVVHQGNPDTSKYDTSCDGVWLLMKDIYEKRQWNSSEQNFYGSSTIHSYLNGTFLGLFDSDVQDAIKTVKIPYVDYNDMYLQYDVFKGADGLSAKIFLLSAQEVGWSLDNDEIFRWELGTYLEYFENAYNQAQQALVASSDRYAYYQGSIARWWLRSPEYGSQRYPVIVDTTGNYYKNFIPATSTAMGVRPALILPSDAMVDPETKEFLGVA